MTQQEAVYKFMPLLNAFGHFFKKKTTVLARPAVAGERIDTITADGKETTNVAKEGDFVVQNNTEAKEQYILSGEKMKSRYEILEAHKSGWVIYKATGLVRAIEFNSAILDLPEQMEFEASWGENMVLKEGDLICAPLPTQNEIYRIARKEFNETYDWDSAPARAMVINENGEVGVFRYLNFGEDGADGTSGKILHWMKPLSIKTTTDVRQWAQFKALFRKPGRHYETL